jgi:hypothetical protein
MMLRQTPPPRRNSRRQLAPLAADRAPANLNRPIENLASPAGLPDFYLAEIDGDAMAPLARDGATAVVDSRERPEEGDLVLVFRAPQFVKPGEFPVVLLQLTDISPWVRFPCRRTPSGDPDEIHDYMHTRQLNPARSLVYVLDNVLTVHKVLWVLPPETIRRGKFVDGASLPSAVVAALAAPLLSLPKPRLAN